MEDENNANPPVDGGQGGAQEAPETPTPPAEGDNPPAE
jgi:hypothetical protein